MERKIRVAVVDDGVDGACVPLAFNLTVDEDGVRENTNVVSRDSHGTICARIIQKYYPQAEIGSIAILNHALRGDKSWLFTAIDLCEEQNVDIVNLSLGSTNIFDVLPVREKIRAQGDMVLVCARSNSGAYTVPASLPGVISVKCDGFYTGEQFSVENGVYVRASGVHDLEGQLTPACNSYAAPLITAKVCGIVEETGLFDAFDIYKQLYRQQNAFLYERTNERMESIPKVCVVDKDFRLKEPIGRVIALFMAEGHSPLLLSGYVGGEFSQCPYLLPAPDIQHIERQIYFALPVYPCDLVILYTDESPRWSGFDVSVAGDVTTVIDQETGRVETLTAPDYRDDPVRLYRDIVGQFDEHAD